MHLFLNTLCVCFYYIQFTYVLLANIEDLPSARPIVEAIGGFVAVLVIAVIGAIVLRAVR